jgi:hypothetical protein
MKGELKIESLKLKIGGSRIGWRGGGFVNFKFSIFNSLDPRSSILDPRFSFGN